MTSFIIVMHLVIPILFSLIGISWISCGDSLLKSSVSCCKAGRFLKVQVVLESTFFLSAATHLTQRVIEFYFQLLKTVDISPFESSVNSYVFTTVVSAIWTFLIKHFFKLETSVLTFPFCFTTYGEGIIFA